MSAVIASEKRALIVGVMRLWSGIGDIRMAENKMSQIAKMYGKKLGEEFKVKCTTGKIIQCRFSKKGLWYQEIDQWNHNWFITDMLIAQLIRGEAVIVDE
jgi:hypothetical protein